MPLLPCTTEVSQHFLSIYSTKIMTAIILSVFFTGWKGNQFKGWLLHELSGVTEVLKKFRENYFADVCNFEHSYTHAVVLWSRGELSSWCRQEHPLYPLLPWQPDCSGTVVADYGLGREVGHIALHIVLTDLQISRQKSWTNVERKTHFFISKLRDLYSSADVLAKMLDFTRW